MKDISSTELSQTNTNTKTETQLNYFAKDLGFAQVISEKEQSRAKKKLKSNRTRFRDPFILRDIDYEFIEICQLFNLNKYGENIAKFIIKLLTRKQLLALWKSLGIILEYMPFEKSRYILLSEREILRNGSPDKLKNVCDRIASGSNFTVHIYLFLADYMEKNAKQDLARFNLWNEYFYEYEKKAAQSIMEIESDHLLSVLMEIPLIYDNINKKEKHSLLQIAIEEDRADFLNNDRVNSIMQHQWQVPSGLKPNINIKRESENINYKMLKLLLNQPFHFYMTPIGFYSSRNILHVIYFTIICIWLSTQHYLDDNITIFEIILWSLNFGYIFYEVMYYKYIIHNI